MFRILLASWVTLYKRRRFRRKMRERWLREGGRPFSHCRRNSTAMEKIGCHGGGGGDGRRCLVRSWMDLKWSHHFGRQFCCRRSVGMVGPYIGGRRRRLKGMKEGVVLPAQWRPVCRHRNAACLPHICRGTVPNFEIGGAIIETRTYFD